MTTRRRFTWLLAGALAFGTACASPPGIEEREIFPEDAAGAADVPLGGTALLQRKRELARAHGDLTHFIATLESLRHRRDRNGAILFSRFIDAYMGTHLDPMLRGEWQSRHPELLGLDANLRVAKAQVFVALRDPRRVQVVLDDLAARYAGRESMLVEFPIGGQSTLAEALALLRKRKWRG
jgi:hypothetical protein